MCEPYSGYSNRETWATNLWLNNDEGLYREVVRLANRADDVYEFSEDLKDFYESLVDEAKAGNEALMTMILDIGSDYRIDWREVAEANWDLKEQDDEPVVINYSDDDDEPTKDLTTSD